MEKIKLLSKPRPVNRQQSILDFNAINEKVGETELQFLLMSDLYDIPLFNITNNATPTLRNRDIEEVYTELFAKLRKKLPLKNIFKVFLFEHKFKKWLRVRGSILHCNFFGLISVLPNPRDLVVRFAFLNGQPEVAYKPNKIPLDLYNQIAPGDQLSLALGLNARPVIEELTEEILNFIDFFVRHHPNNVKHIKSIPRRQPSIFSPVHKHLCGLAGQVELHLRCVGFNKGNQLFYDNNGKVWSKKLERVKQELMGLRLPTVLPHRQMIDDMQNLRNKVVHCNFIQLIHKLEQMHGCQFVGGVYQLSLNSGQTTPLNNTSSISNSPNQNPNTASQNISIPLFGMFLQAYNSGLPLSFEQDCLNFIQASTTM